MAIGALVLPACALLLVGLSSEWSQPEYAALALYGYALALGAGLLAPRGWLNYWWYRTWERENGRPLLIKYLEDRYSGSRQT